MSQTINERNQKNAQSSTGPQTAEGKTKSSRNSLKHGMYAKVLLLDDEDREEYLEFTTAIKADLKPASPLQEEFAQLVCDNFWRMRRFRAMETNQLERLAFNAKKRNGSEPGEALALAWQDDCNGSLERLARHEQRLSNQTHKALKQLKDLQREARELAQQEIAQALSKPKETKAAAASGFVSQHAQTAAMATPIPPAQPHENPTTSSQKLAA